MNKGEVNGRREMNIGSVISEICSRCVKRKRERSNGTMTGKLDSMGGIEIEVSGTIRSTRRHAI